MPHEGANAVTLALLALITIVAVLVLVGWMRIVKLWLPARAAGVPIRVEEIIGMWLRRTNPRAIVQALILARQAGVQLSREQLERHALAGGRVAEVVAAMVREAKAGRPADWNALAAADLAGAPAAPEAAPPAGRRVEDVASQLKGQAGVAETYIPSPGRVTVAGRPVPAVSAGPGIERGAAVEIVEVSTHVVVRAK